MKATCLAMLGLGACQVAPEPPSVPRLYGLSDVVTSERGSAAATRLLEDWSEVDSSCAASAYPAIRLVADVAPTPGSETILGSYAHGLVVLDRDGRLAGSMLGYPCEGSADEVEILAAGDAYGDRTIVVVGTSGGHRERSTWIGLFRLGRDRRLDPVFTGNIEEHRGSDVRYGAIYMLPSALVHERPRGTAVFYIFDPTSRMYVRPGEQLDDTDHDGPDAANADFVSTR